MRTIYLLCAVALACGAGLFLGQVMAQEGDEGGMQTPAWIKPTAEHAAFKKHVGEWTGTMRWWMTPDQEPSESTIEVTASLVLGGMYLQYDVRGNFEGHAWTGRWVLGYDTVDKEYVAIWMNSMGPVTVISRGTAEDGVLNLEGAEPDHMTGEKKDSRHAVEWKGDDKIVFTFYGAPEGDEERKTGEIVYTRKK